MNINGINIGDLQSKGQRESDPRANEEKHRHAERMRLRDFISACMNKGSQLRWVLAEDRIRAGRALGELRDRLKAHGHTVDEVEAHFPKLYRFIKGETGKILPYLEAARIIAEVAGLDIEESQLSVLRNTDRWQNWGRTSPNNSHTPIVDEAANAVAFQLEELSARIARDSGLASLFSRMRRVPGVWDIRKQCFRANSMACLFQTAYCEWTEHWEEAPPLPSVPLVRLWHVGWMLPVRLATADSVEVSSKIIGPAVETAEGHEVEARIDLCREIRLAIAPTVKAEMIGPLFESRAWACMSILNEDGSVRAGGPLDPSCDLWLVPPVDEDGAPTGSIAVQLDDLWHRVSPLANLEGLERNPENVESIVAVLDGRVRPPDMWDHTPLSPQRSYVEHYYLSWTPVDAAHVTHWLDRYGDDLSQPVRFLPDIPDQKPAGQTWYPRPFLAHAVESAIADGRLEAALRTEVRRISEAFDIYETEWMTCMQGQTAEQIARFRSDLPSGDHAP